MASTAEIRLKSSIVSGLIEVITTHPMDYAKTILQSSTNRQVLFEEFKRNPYKGLSSRILGIVPMRILFWNSITYFKDLGYNPILAGTLTAIVQTAVDFPIEQIKTQKMLKNNHGILDAFRGQPTLFKGFGCNLARNIGFAVVLNCVVDGTDGSYYHGAIGGFLGALLTQPFDTLKTWYQVGHTNYPKDWTIANYYKVGAK